MQRAISTSALLQPRAAASARQSRPQAPARHASFSQRSFVRIPAARLASRRVAGRRAQVAVAAEAGAAVESSFVQVLAESDLPKGTRKVVQVSGKSIMLFFYRDALYAIEARSPAEGAYSEGFTTARFTQDGAIVCPTTGSTFDLKTGEIREWYPNNTVLRMLTPKELCRPMEVFPVKAEGGVLSVDVGNTNLAALVGGAMELTSAITTGGAESSLERNNVYGIEPPVYLQDGSAVSDGQGGTKAKIEPATLIIGTVAIAIVAVAGTAWFLSKEEVIQLGLFWVALFIPVAAFVVKFSDDSNEPGPPQ